MLCWLTASVWSQYMEEHYKSRDQYHYGRTNCSVYGLGTHSRDVSASSRLRLLCCHLFQRVSSVWVRAAGRGSYGQNVQYPEGNETWRCIRENA